MQKIFDRYIQYLEAERNASPYTIRNYKDDLLDFFYFLRKKKIDPLTAVDRHILRDYMKQLGERRVVKGSIARKMSAIRSFYRYLTREELIPKNPVEQVSSLKLDRRLPSFLTKEEMEKLLNAPDLSTPLGQRNRALLELLYASGLRVSELVSLTPEQINLESNEIRVLGKGSKERMVLMGEPAAEAIKSYIGEGRLKLTGKKKSQALFLDRYGQSLTARSVQRLLEQYAKKAGIGKRVHPHMLRHTFATHMLDGGADLRVVQELLGHARLTSTQIYTHVTKGQARKVYLSAHPLAREEKDEPKDKE
jgi:integrase/recombinase XerC